MWQELFSDNENSPEITIEHVQVDTDEALASEDDSQDPVLKVLYSEPLNWMGSRSSDEDARSWGTSSTEDSLIADADEDDTFFDDDEDVAQ